MPSPNTFASKFEGKWYGPQVTSAMEKADETLKVFMDPSDQYWIAAVSREDADKHLREYFVQEGRHEDAIQEYFQPCEDEEPSTPVDYRELDSRLKLDCWVSPDSEGNMKPDEEGYDNVEQVTLYAAEWAAVFGSSVMFGCEGR